MGATADARTRTFKFWSAASSSGEEPYTVALVLAEYARVHGSLHWQIEGSDISSRILDDSAVVRRMISHALASDPEIEG